MTMITRKTTTAAVAVLLSLTSALAVAHGMRGEGRGLADLNLSAAQKTQIEQIRQQYRPAAQPDDAARQTRFQQWHNQKQQLLQGRQFNESAARQLIQQRQQQQAEHELQHLRQQHAIFQVLNAEQQQKWLAKRGEGKGWGRGGEGGRKHERKAPSAQVEKTSNNK